MPRHHGIEGEKGLKELVLRLIMLGAPKARTTKFAKQQTMTTQFNDLFQALLTLIVLVFYVEDMPMVPQARWTKKQIDFLFPKRNGTQAWECVEFFAGDGRVGKSPKWGMVATAQLELNYGQHFTKTHRSNAFDLTTPNGLASLGFLCLGGFGSNNFFCGMQCQKDID